MEDMENIIRKPYLDKIEQALGKDVIIVLAGQRRIGKSYLLRQLKDEKAKDSSNNIIFVDKEKKEFDDIRNYRDLNAFIDEHRVEGKKNYILVDEIQDIMEFERTVRSYREEPATEIVITGSTSLMLSSELTTLIGGRYKEIYVQALSYNEFLTFQLLPDNDESLAQYINLGGLPGLRKIGLDENDVREYQQDVLNTVLLKDVIMRNNIRNPVFLENLIRFLADNTGKIFSANSISRYMRGLGQNVTSTAIINYIQALCETYVIHKVHRYDIHGKRLFETNDKYYFEDVGIRNTQTLVGRDKDIEKVIENIVYQQLVYNGYKVQVGQLQAGEIDFVCTKGTSRIYVQASYLIAGEETREREFGALKKIKDNYPKYVISMTPLVTRTDDDGIIHLSLREFLASGF